MNPVTQLTALGTVAQTVVVCCTTLVAFVHPHGSVRIANNTSASQSVLALSEDGIRNVPSAMQPPKGSYWQPMVLFPYHVCVVVTPHSEGPGVV